VLTEEVHAAGVADKIAGHEDAAHEKRNWVRLTYDCNNRCVFCLDSDTHDGEIRDREEVKQQILDGRRKHATRLILSGGEPTMHPNYLDFIALGVRAGYRKIQTVTNGRMFSYPEFLQRCLQAGLSEITFSLHGPNAKIHDALVGVKGAFEQETAGLKNAIASQKVIVNVDIVINRANVKHLAEMLETFIGFGVREFDLLQVVPFGRAFTEGRDTLFYDLEEARPHLLAALEYSKRPDIHMWLNRFPPQHLEGYEHLIQDPYKLNDEVRGRKEEFARLLDVGTALECREPERCKYCYLEKLCDTLEVVRAGVRVGDYEVVRVDSEWEAKQEPVFGGDPASARRAVPPGGARRLPLYGEPGATGAGGANGANGANGGNGANSADGERNGAAQLDFAALGAETFWIRAPSLERARAALSRHPRARRVELELDDWTGVDAATLDGKPIARAVVRRAADARALLALDAFEVAVELTRETAAWLLSLAAAPAPLPARLVLRQPTYERLTEAAEHDVDLRDFFARFPHAVPVEGIPACVTSRAPRPRPRILDTAMLTEGGRVEIFRYTKRYITEHYSTKSLRCRTCAHDADCAGMHVNYVRAHGYAFMQPVAR
jgi:MoaA/NifB/PqqE/SkfB family radical SAM enzyme